MTRNQAQDELMMGIDEPDIEEYMYDEEIAKRVEQEKLDDILSASKNLKASLTK